MSGHRRSKNQAEFFSFGLNGQDDPFGLLDHDFKILDERKTRDAFNWPERYKKGDAVDTVILALDPDNRKISLGIKQLDKDPWTTVASEYKIGDVIEGTVSKITNFGAFVKLPTGIEGLVHISELSSNDVSKVEDLLKVVQVSQFKVIKVSPEERKLGLSLRALKEPAAPAPSAPAEQPDDSERAKARSAAREMRESEQKQKAKEPAKNALQQALEEHAAKNKKQ